jgi:starvation-inducible DNA-binding protein
MTAELLTGHGAVTRQLRAGGVACDEEPGDAGTTDFLAGLMEQHENVAWMLRAVLEEKNQAQTKGITKPLTIERK